jgi:hypothetical protein
MRIALSGSGRVPRRAASRSSSEIAVQPEAFSQSKNCANDRVVTLSVSSSSSLSTTSWKEIDTKRCPAGWARAGGTEATPVSSSNSRRVSRRIAIISFAAARS